MVTDIAVLGLLAASAVAAVATASEFGPSVETALGRISMIVTSDPNSLNMQANSQPIIPAPMIRILFGIDVSFSASVLESIFSPSKGNAGI